MNHSVELNMRDLTILYVIADWNKSEISRLEECGYPRLSWSSAAQPVGITLLLGGSKNPEMGKLNQFLINNKLGDPIRSVELVYRSIRDKLRPGGLLYDATEAPESQFAPTRPGIRVYEELVRLGSPKAWPDRLPVSNGIPNWQLAKFPLLPAYE